jgi:hypothetical protein
MDHVSALRGFVAMLTDWRLDRDVRLHRLMRSLDVEASAK